MAANVTSVLQACHHALPWLARSGCGAVINVSSIAALQASSGGDGGGLAYGATKAAIIGMTRNLAAELGPRGVRVNCIVPGHLATPSASAQKNQDLRRQVSMLEREGLGWDVAWAAVFLASDEARYITAVSLPVDGGATQQLALSAVLRLRDAEP